MPLEQQRDITSNTNRTHKGPRPLLCHITASHSAPVASIAVDSTQDQSHQFSHSSQGNSLINTSTVQRVTNIKHSCIKPSEPAPCSSTTTYWSNWRAMPIDTRRAFFLHSSFLSPE